MTDTILIMLRACIVMLFGMAVSLLFAGVQRTRAGNLANAFFYTLMLFAQILCWHMFGMQTTLQLYPFIAHLPVIIFIVLYFKRPWLISISSVLAAYLCCQIPRWIGSVAGAISGIRLVNHISYFVATCIVYYILKRYVADSVRQLMDKSTRSCLLFGAVPLLYYLFDYATTFYTDLLYTGAPGVVQFTPSMICTFYLVFVLLYYKESLMQANAKRERDIFASQLQQAQFELDTMRTMQNNTVIYRHDMRHHLSLIGGFAADGDLKKISEYLATTKADIDALTPVRYCENETVNLIYPILKHRQKRSALFYMQMSNYPKN